MNHIELFAGCGGLSLGLEASGFNLILANELSPMAAESFAFNLLGEDLSETALKSGIAKHTCWITSSHKQLKYRLRENPYQFPKPNSADSFSDITSDFRKLQGKLLIGSIIDLNILIDSEPEFAKTLFQAFGRGELDLVSGGPPCQSFSMAGLRNKNCDKNVLPWEFAKFVSKTKPKIALLENVTGILHAFKDSNGKNFHAWFEVAKAFALIGYVPLCLHINARSVGIPQNRPRFIMISIREDFFQEIQSNISPCSAEAKLFNSSINFFLDVKKDIDAVDIESLTYFDTGISEHRALFQESFLSGLIGKKEVSVKDAIDDLKRINNSDQSDYVRKLNSIFEKYLPAFTGIHNHIFRKHGEVVRRRFKIYQILQLISDPNVSKDLSLVLKGIKECLDITSWLIIKNYDFGIEPCKSLFFSTKEQCDSYLRAHVTKKQIQKSLDAHRPAPTTLSIPDDACHYDLADPRALTVRELARIQSFPDSFVFRSKETTGSHFRKFETPQYTQVGNAVPPLLGLALGETIKKLMAIAERSKSS